MESGDTEIVILPQTHNRDVSGFRTETDALSSGCTLSRRPVLDRAVNEKSPHKHLLLSKPCSLMEVAAWKYERATQLDCKKAKGISQAFPWLQLLSQPAAKARVG